MNIQIAIAGKLNIFFLRKILNLIFILIDEAHYLKNGQAKRTEALTPILVRCKHVILLTGTPALARPKELFSLVSILRPDIFNNFRDFGNR